MSNPSISQYRETQVTSATPEKTVLMLYDGAIGFLRSAIKEIEENNNIPEKALLVEKAMKIIDYLQSCLDMEKGGEISTNLERLYQYMSVELTKANLKNDTKKMEEVVGLLMNIREGWNDICNKKANEIKKVQDNAYASAGISDNTGKPKPQMIKSVGIKA